MEPARILPLLASLQMLPWPVSPEDWTSAPELTVSSQHQVFLPGESVTLTCSAPSTDTISGIQFFRDGQKISSGDLQWSQDSVSSSLLLSSVSESHAGTYSCESWKTESGKEIPSERSQTISIRVTAPLPAPQLTVDPDQPVYITGEVVTLTCSADLSPTESGIRFYRASQEITSPHGGYTKSLELPSVSAGEYSCESWKTVSGREIKSARSQPRSIRVTARPPAPTLTVSSQHRVFLRGESVTLTCSAPSTDTASGIRFLRGDQRIGSGKFQRSNARSLQLLSVSETNTGEYSCEYWKKESEREIPSERSRSISITVTAPLPAPQLTVDPDQPVYIAGEVVTLTCSADVSPTVSGIRFYRASQEITSPHGGYTKSLQLRSVSAGEYSCESWETVSGREIKSARSQPRSIGVTARPPAPELTVSSQYRVFLPGEFVTLMCSAPSTDTASGIRFFKDGQSIDSRELQRYSYYVRSLQLLRVSESHAGVYSCDYLKTESGREIPSERSQNIPIAVTARPSAPELTVNSQYRVFLPGESVTLTCSAPSTDTVSGMRFFRSGQSIDSREFQRYSYKARSLQLSSVSESHAGVYSCDYLKTESGREIPSERSQTISITVTASLPVPQITVSQSQPVYITGEDVTLTCSAVGAPTVSGIRFYRDSREIQSNKLPSPRTSHTESLPLLSVSAVSAGQYSCESWKIVSGREIKSARSKSCSIRVTARPPPPSLSLDPPEPIYIQGERVTLRCSGQLYERAAGYRFFNQRGEQISSGESSQGTWQISTRDAAASQAYTCLYWRVERGREIPSEKSPPVPVSVTDPPPQPELSVAPSSGKVSEGFSLNITCTAPGDARDKRFHFYKDGVELIPRDLGSKMSTMEPSTSSVKGSVLSIPWAGSNITGEFACGYEENVAGRWILSHRSWTVNVTVDDSQRIRDILLGAGGILLLIAILAALLCYCCRKKRVPKTPKSADESAPREHARNLDPSHDTKGSKAAGAGAEQMKQGSEVTYALLALPASKPHTTRSKNKSKPVEDEHVLYSEVVTTHNQKKAK